jgi:hypothetical protein
LVHLGKPLGLNRFRFHHLGQSQTFYGHDNNQDDSQGY